MTTQLTDKRQLSPEEKQQRAAQREKNRRVIERTQFNYLYITGSKVFHRRTCKLCLNAKNQGRISGSHYYNTAAKGRRPCKRCKPVPNLSYLSSLNQSPAQKKKQKNHNTDRTAYEQIKAKMLNGKVITIQRGRILGWCRHQLHQGAVSKSFLDSHDCLGKNCPYLVRNSVSPFWLAREKQMQSEANRKKAKKQEKQKKAQEQATLQSLTEQWISLLESRNIDLQIVRVAMQSPTVYTIYYVSDNRCSDWGNYSGFLDELKAIHPDFRIHLRHIRDVDGHFVTREEYRNRRKK